MRGRHMRRRFGRFVLDIEAASLTCDGAPIDVQPKVLDLVSLLAASPERIFTKQELMRALWPGVHVTGASLHQSMRKARRALGDDPDAPTFIEAVPRRGWRWIASETRPPATENGLVGRDDILRDLESRCVPGAALVLHGPGGVGKTRLATALADRFAGVVSPLVSLLGCRAPADVVHTVATTLGIPLETPTVALGRDAIGRWLAAFGPILVVLDEVEAAAAAVGDLLGCWRTAAPSAIWLLTSRTRIAGAVAVPVPPLSDADAAELLRTCVGRAGGHLGEAEIPALLEPLDGLPLAIELTASRLRLIPADRLAARLRDGLQVLSSGEGRSLWVSLRTSWELLEDADRHLLCGCAVFPGAFDAEAIEALVPDAPGRVLDGLERLIGASLVRSDGGRLGVTGLVREFAQAEAERSGTGGALIRTWIGEIARRARTALPEALRWDADTLASLRVSRDDLVAASRRCAPDDPARDALAVGVAFGCRYGGPWDLADELLSRLPVPSPLARVCRAEYAVRLGRVAEAVALLEAADGDDTVRAWAAFLLARIRAATGRLPEAGRLAEGAAERAEQAGNDALLALALDALGTVRGATGDLDGMRASYDRALGRLEHRSMRLARVIVAQNYAASLGRFGLHAEASLRLRVAVEAVADLPMPHLASVVRGNLASALLATGRAAEAAPLLALSLVESRRLGDLVSAAAQAEALALACAIAGDGDRAETLLDEARRSGAVASIALRRTWAALARGEHDVARVRIASALALAPEADRPEILALTVGLAHALGDRAWVDRAAPDAVSALDSRPELLAVVRAWSEGREPVLDRVTPGTLPADVWMLCAPPRDQRTVSGVGRTGVSHEG